MFDFGPLGSEALVQTGPCTFLSTTTCVVVDVRTLFGVARFVSFVGISSAFFDYSFESFLLATDFDTYRVLATPFLLEGSLALGI